MLRMAKVQRTRIGVTLALCFGIALFTGCAAMNGTGGSNGQTSSGVTVSPGPSNVRAGDTLQFSAKVTGAMD